MYRAQCLIRKWVGLGAHVPPCATTSKGRTKLTTSGSHDVIAITPPWKNDLCTEELRDKAKSLDEVSLPLETYRSGICIGHLRVIKHLKALCPWLLVSNFVGSINLWCELHHLECHSFHNYYEYKSNVSDTAILMYSKGQCHSWSCNLLV